MADKLYEIMIEACSKGEMIICNATADTSLTNIKRMIEKGLAEIYEIDGRKIVLNEEKELVYDTGEKIEYRNFKKDSDIKMIDLGIKPNLEKMKEERRKIKNLLEIGRKQIRMSGRTKEENIEKERRRIRKDLER